MFVTPMPPTISASSEKIQPVGDDQAARGVDLDRLPGLGHRGDAGEAALEPLRDRPSAARRACTVTPIVVTSRGRLRERLHDRQRQDGADVHEAVAGVVDAGDPEACACRRDEAAGLRAPSTSPPVAEHRLVAAGRRPETITRRCVAELASGRGRRGGTSPRLERSPRRGRPARSGATPGSRVRSAARASSGQQRAGQVGGVRLEEAEVGAADVDQVARRLAARPR